jgi:ubiquinone/menaquinone biosynthesis C-methylase UbiE
MLSTSTGRMEGVASPQPLLEAAWGFALTRVLATAIELDLFTTIARGHTALDTLARATGCSVRGLARLLNVLTALGCVERHDGRYTLPPMAAAFLTTTSPSHIGPFVVHQTNESWSPWERLSEVVRRGMPATASLHGTRPDVEFFSPLVQSLYALNAAAAGVAALALTNGRADATRQVLDVAAGSAVWSLALAHRDPQALVTVVDLPDVVDRVTRQFVEREGVSNRYTFWPADIWQVDFGEDRFDVVILGHICHGEGAERTQRLIARTYRALRSGGQLLIAEFMPDDDRRGPLMPLLFALHMLVLTDQGDAFTLAEYRRWLSQAGFGEVRTIDAPAPSPLIVATKP